MTHAYIADVEAYVPTTILPPLSTPPLPFVLATRAQSLYGGLPLSSPYVAPNKACASRTASDCFFLGPGRRSDG